MSITHLLIIAVFFFIGGLGMAAVQSAFAAFYAQARRGTIPQHNAADAHHFPTMHRKLVWK